MIDRVIQQAVLQRLQPQWDPTFSEHSVQEVEAVTATAEPESPASTEHLMEAICDPANIEAALRTVVRNKGAPGVDGITVKRLPGTKRAGLRSKINCSGGATSRSRCVG